MIPLFSGLTTLVGIYYFEELLVLPEGKIALPLHPDGAALVGLLRPAQALVRGLQALRPPLVPASRSDTDDFVDTNIKKISQRSFVQT